VKIQDDAVTSAKVDGTVATVAGTETLTNKTLTAPTINGGTHTAFTSTGIDDNATSTAITIDASENVLVGTTSTSSSTQGIKLRPDLDAIIAMADGQQAAYFGRLNSDGEIVSFKKDGTNVGSWMSRAGLVSTIILDPRTNGAGLTAAGSIMQPTNHAGVLTDGVLDIGEAPYRFKDLYLSGGVVFGPASASNVSSQTLSSYEQGTFTPTLGASGYTFAYTYQSGVYIKIGNMVSVKLFLRCSGTPSGSGSTGLSVNGLPFTQGGGVANYGGGGILIEGSDNLFTGIPAIRSNPSVSYLTIYDVRAGNSPTATIDCSKIDATDEFEISMIYHT
jgi:hypothetical protein